MKGNIFDIQTYSIHDGPGIRTTVFLKGCPLRCLWCQNPESQKFVPQLMVYKTLCTGCGACVLACPSKAIRLDEGKTATDRKLCVDCGVCANICPASARKLVGMEVEADEIAAKACADKMFFDFSGGGVTLSGGEILAQPEFAAEILRSCKKRGVNTAIETCGHGSWKALRNILEYTDLVLYDFKHMSPSRHKELTGIDNALILENAKKTVHEMNKELIGRIPVIPDYNDSDENIEQTARFIADKLKPGIKVHLLPFNPLAQAKEASLEMSGFVEFKRSSEERLSALKKILDNNGLVGIIGG